MKRLKGLISVLALAILIMSQATPVFAEDKGGWIENEGNYASDFDNFSRASNPVHTGSAENSTINGTSVKRAKGSTKWTGVYHYTRARVEDVTFGINFGVLTDSGRVWGTSSTSATSPWWYFNGDTLGTAYTYYGN